MIKRFDIGCAVEWEKHHVRKEESKDGPFVFWEDIAPTIADLNMLIESGEFHVKRLDARNDELVEENEKMKLELENYRNAGHPHPCCGKVNGHAPNCEWLAKHGFGDDL